MGMGMMGLWMGLAICYADFLYGGCVYVSV